MKKFFKSLCACFVMLVIFAGAMSLVGCGKKEEERLMNVSMNPSLEFVLDKNDKVVSVTATNDDGNYILTKVDFEGKTAKEAVEAFLTVAKENGFAIAGDVDATENELKISISGEDAKALYNEVKSYAKSKLEALDLNAKISFEGVISKDELATRVSQLMQEIPVDLAKEMTREELVALIQESHEQTEELLSQELKELYYKTRAEEIVKAKFEAVKGLIASGMGVFGEFLNNVNTNLTALVENIASYKEAYTEQVLSGVYAQEMQEYMQAKKNLLEAQMKTEVDPVVLASLETAVAEAENTLAQAKTNAESLMMEMTNAINIAISGLNQALNGALNILETILKDGAETINQAVNNVKDSYKTAFETEFASYIAQAETLWQNMQPSTPNVE